MRLENISPNYICQHWAQVEPFLRNALTHSAGEYDVQQLKGMLVRGEQILLVFVDDDRNIYGALTVVFENFPNDRIAFVTSLGGRGVTTPEHWNAFEDWCRHNGATKTRGATEGAAIRLWRQKFGMKPCYTLMEKSL